MDIDFANLEPPQGVHFGIVPKTDFLNSNALLEIVARYVTECSDYTLEEHALEVVHLANMELL